MMRPYPGRFLPKNKWVFNYCLSQTRRVIENTFGIMTSKFCIFRRDIVASPGKVTKITQATCCLHNYLKISEAHNPSSQHHCCPPGYADREDTSGNVAPGDWRLQRSEGIRDIQRVGSITFSRSASELRDNLMEYSVSPHGSLP